MKIYLIRHGQTDWNMQGKIQGSRDCPLNENGILQATELGKRLLDDEVQLSTIYSSRLKRASKTAEILSHITAVEHHNINGLEEISLGSWEGLTWGQVKQDYPVEYADWYVARRYTKPPHGESYDEMLSRVLSCLRDIIARHDEDVAVVTHSAVIMCLQCYLTQTPFENMTQFKMENMHSTVIESQELLSYE